MRSTAHHRWIGCLLVAVAFLGAAPSVRAQGDDDVRARILAHVEQLRSGHPLTIAGSPIASRLVLPEFYEGRDFAPAWSDEANRADLLRAIAAAEADGLDPAHYHADLLQQLSASAAGDAAARAGVDLLFTDALIRLGYHLILGRVDPASLDSNWNLRGDLGDLDPVDAIEAALASGQLFEAIESYKPTHPLYVALKAALAEYRELAARGGWDPVPDFRVEAGAGDGNVPALRRRLAASGDLPGTSSLTSQVYDDELQEAVRQFQRRHGLNDDATLGPHTLAAMNVTVGERIDQMRLNLERGRWVLRDLEDSFVAVNIAGFRVYVVRDGEPIWNNRVVVGKLHHESPVFKDQMEYIVLNPTWTIPGGITRNEMLPNLRRDPGYLAAKHMVMLDSGGRQVDPATVDLSGGSFPYVLRQEPGPWNALGQVKFIFPNQHNVYLHDTPSRQLFASEVRAFSHGCIRVQDPLDLAEVLLAGKPGWDRARIDATIDSAETTTVHLDEPLPVLILYWTAWVNPRGELKFYEDVYDRDDRILRGLDEDFGVDIDAARAGLVP